MGCGEALILVFYVKVARLSGICCEVCGICSEASAPHLQWRPRDLCQQKTLPVDHWHPGQVLNVCTCLLGIITENRGGKTEVSDN